MVREYDVTAASWRWVYSIGSAQSVKLQNYQLQQ